MALAIGQSVILLIFINPVQPIAADNQEAEGIYSESESYLTRLAPALPEAG